MVQTIQRTAGWRTVFFCLRMLPRTPAGVYGCACAACGAFAILPITSFREKHCFLKTDGRARRSAGRAWCSSGALCQTYLPYVRELQAWANGGNVRFVGGASVAPAFYMTVLLLGRVGCSGMKAG